MLQFKIEIRNKDVISKLHRNYQQAEYKFCQKISDILMQNIRYVFRNYMKHTRRHGWNYQYTGKVLASFSSRIDKTSFGYRITSAPRPPYDSIVRLLEYGGEVRPKAKRYLRVPLKNTPLPFNAISVSRLVRKGHYLFMNNIPVFVLKAVTRHPPYFPLHRALIKAKYNIRKVFGEEVLKSF